MSAFARIGDFGTILKPDITAGNSHNPGSHRPNIVTGLTDIFATPAVQWKQANLNCLLFMR